MTQYSSSRETLRNSLQDYAAFLHEKNQTLTEISHAGASLLIMLKNDLPEGMDNLIKEREQACRRLIDLCKNDSWKDLGLMDRARKLAANNSDDLCRLARELLELNVRAQRIGDEVLNSQKECEAIMKSQLDATSSALQHSVRKRKLSSAYGPVSTQHSPTFLDRQR